MNEYGQLRASAAKSVILRRTVQTRLASDEIAFDVDAIVQIHMVIES